MALEAKVKLTLVDKVTKKINDINNRINKINTLATKTGSTMAKWPKVIQESVNNAKKLQSEFKKNNTLVKEFASNLKGIFAAYGGVMTIRAVVQTSDTITGAENRLNYANGGNAAATEQSMDKIYAASQRARTGYDDMLSNVGKSMALAGDTAFKGNVDNAIKFQEIMSKSYAIGGASAAEQASSMYQMVQALGSGILQGDELRSVREGAPLAYKEIEKFAQKTLQSEESLKDLASQGKITSDIVVAAMLNAGDSIDKAFGDTDMTIAQAFETVKNTAINAFRPIQDTITNFLNSTKGQQFINGISIAVQGLISVLGALMEVVVNVATWFVDNWYWVQWIVYAVGIAILYVAIVAIGQVLVSAILKVAATGWLAWLPWLFMIALVVAGIVWLANTAKDGCDFIYNVCYLLTMAIIGLLAVVLVIYLVTGAIILSTTALTVLLIIAIIALIVMAIAKYGEEIGGFIGGLCGAIGAIVYNVIMFFKKLLGAFVNWIKAVGENIGILMSNPWEAAKLAFWSWVYDCLDGISWLEPAFNAIAKLFGLEGVTLSGLTAKVKAKITSIESDLKLNDLSSAWDEGWDNAGNYKDISDAWDAGKAKGAAIGANVQNKINGVFDAAKNGLKNLGTDITNDLGIDSDFNANNPEYALNTDDFDPNKLNKGVGNIDDNTGKIKDTMDLAEEDLEYLRSLAEMEWKKEFTTASIVVDMKNNNTINNQGDLDGWIGVLSDKLREELDVVANGVYTVGG